MPPLDDPEDAVLRIDFIIRVPLDGLTKYNSCSFCSVLSLWPEQVQKNGNGFQPFPANLIYAEVKDESTYGQLISIAKECSDTDCPVVNNGLRGIQTLRICKEHYSKSLPSLVRDLGAAPDFMTSVSNLALGSLLYADRPGSAGDEEPQPIFPVERKQWTTSNGDIDTLVTLLKKSVIRFEILQPATDELLRITKPQSASSSTSKTVDVKRSPPSSSSASPHDSSNSPSSSSSSNSSLSSSSTTTTPSLPSSKTQDVKRSTMSTQQQLLVSSSSSSENSTLPSSPPTSSSSLSYSSSATATPTPTTHPSVIATNASGGGNTLDKDAVARVIDKEEDDDDDTTTTPKEKNNSSKRNSDHTSTSDEKDTGKPNVEVSKTNDDNSHVQVNINIRVTLDAGNNDEGKSQLNADKDTLEQKTVIAKVKAASVEDVAVKSPNILKAIKDASSSMVGNTLKSINESDPAILQATTNSKISLNEIIKDLDGTVISNLSKTSDLDERSSSIESGSSNDNESNMQVSKRTINGLIDALIDTLHDNTLPKDVSNTKNTINIGIAVTNNTETTKSQHLDSVEEDMGESSTTRKSSTTLFINPSTSTNGVAPTTISPPTIAKPPSPTRKATQPTTPSPSPSSPPPPPPTTKAPTEEPTKPPTLDSVSYYSIRKFLDEELQHRDVYLLPVRVSSSQVAQQHDEDKDDDNPSSSDSSESPSPPQPPSSHFHEVDLTVTAASVHALLISSVSGLVDIRTDVELQSIFGSSLRMLTWFMNHQDDLRSMVSMSYFPSRFQLYWMTSRIAFQLNLTPVNDSGIFNFARAEIGPFMKSLQDIMTLTILSSIKDGGLGADGQTRVFLDDFIGVGDKNVNGQVSGDDRLFTSALAANTLMSTWCSPTFQPYGLLQFHKGTPDSVRIAVNSLVNYVTKNVLDPKASLTNAYISEKVKGCQTLPPWYPFNTVTTHTGQDVKPEKADTSLRFGVEGYLTPQVYKAEEKKTRFGISLPTVKEIQDINDPTSVFRFWSSKELTRAVCLLAIAQAADLKVEDGIN